MKKTGRKRFFVLLMITALLTGCSFSGNGTADEVKEIRIGVLLYNQDDMFINDMMEYMDVGFREKEKEENFKITFNFSDAKGNQTVQNDQADKYIEQNYDVLCVNLVDRTDAAIMIDKGKKADIPIVFFNREPVSADMQRWEKTYYVGVDAAEGGRMQGDIFLEKYYEWPERDKNGDGIIQYVLLEGEQGHQDTTIRTESCIKRITSAGVKLERLEAETANWRRSQAKEIMHEWLSIYGDTIELAICNNDEMGLGVSDAFAEIEANVGTEEGGKYYCPVIGLDGIPEAVEEVREGCFLGTVLNDAKGQAQGVMDLAIALGKGENPIKVEYLRDDRSVRVPHKIILH